MREEGRGGVVLRARQPNEQRKKERERDVYPLQLMGEFLPFFKNSSFRL